MTGKFAAIVQAIKKSGLYRENPVYTPIDATHVTEGGRRYLVLSSNNYLGFTHHPAVRQAALEAVQAYGTGSGGARLTSGSHPLFRLLEREIAAFKGTEAALVFNTGYMANLGTISALVGEEDTVFSDALNHASIIDGCRLSGARKVVFAHSDLRDLEAKLQQASRGKKRLIVVDGVFSMDGDVTPLEGLAELAQRYDALLMVDDAHATGVLGGGRGTAAHFGLEGAVDIQMGTLSKALGAEGAYVAGRKELIDFLINRARSYIFSTALSPAPVAAALAAVRLLREDASAVRALQENASVMRAALRSQGLRVAEHPTPIIPLVLGTAKAAVRAAARLKERGILLSAIRPPTVAEGQSRLRLAVSAAHVRSELLAAAGCIAETVKECGV